MHTDRDFILWDVEAVVLEGLTLSLDKFESCDVLTAVFGIFLIVPDEDFDIAVEILLQ